MASDEIGQAIKKLNKTKVAWIREVGASGGYWIASATDKMVLRMRGKFITESFVEIRYFSYRHSELVNENSYQTINL